MENQSLVFEGQFLPTQAKQYIHLPFEVPEHAARLEVEYWYSHQIDSDPLLSGGNTLDLGVFDARGIDFLHAGFRGWSGSERHSFFITETEATPGYLAGPLTPGRWHVLLGLYKIAPEGCAYRVTVSITVGQTHASKIGAQVANQDLPASPVSHRRGQWLRGEMHCHTLHSDGDSPAASVVGMARARGLDFLAITDHNTISCQRELEALREPGLILIRGVEVTTFKGHWNVWGIDDWVDFRVARPAELAAAIHFARARGAVTVCNHPKPFGPAWDFPEVEGYHAIEVWNGPWYLMNQLALDFWTERLAQGKRIVATGGSDWHTHAELEQSPPRAPGTPTLWVYVPGAANATAILQAIRRGHVALSDEPDGPLLDLRGGFDGAARGGDVLAREPDAELFVQVHCERGAGYVLTLLDQQNVLLERTLVAPEETVAARLQTRNSLYVRAELRARDDDLKALTNPIYLEPAR